MSSKKISQLPAATESIDTDEIPVNQSGNTKKVTVDQIAVNETIWLSSQVFG